MTIARMLAMAVLTISAGPALAASGEVKPTITISPRGEVSVGVTFTPAERSTIQDYFSRSKQKADRLPPGIAKNVGRGKPLPPGIAKKALPQDLLRRLPARDGYDRVIIGSDILLIELATGVVVDALRGVLR